MEKEISRISVVQMDNLRSLLAIRLMRRMQSEKVGVKNVVDERMERERYGKNILKICII